MQNAPHSAAKQRLPDERFAREVKAHSLSEDGVVEVVPGTKILAFLAA